MQHTIACIAHFNRERDALIASGQNDATVSIGSTVVYRGTRRQCQDYQASLKVGSSVQSAASFGRSWNESTPVPYNPDWYSGSAEWGCGTTLHDRLNGNPVCTH